MPDIADEADREVEYLAEAAYRDASSKVNRMVTGTPGECIMCGEERPRLVDGACCHCRDKYKLP